METLRKLGFYGELDDCHICPQGKLKHSELSRRTPYSEQLFEQFHWDQGLVGRKIMFLFSRRDVKKDLRQETETRSEVATITLELIKKKQPRTQASLIYLRNYGANDYTTQAL
jgi:hypothetical protein